MKQELGSDFSPETWASSPPVLHLHTLVHPHFHFRIVSPAYSLFRISQTWLFYSFISQTTILKAFLPGLPSCNLASTPSLKRSKLYFWSCLKSLSHPLASLRETSNLYLAHKSLHCLVLIYLTSFPSLHFPYYMLWY